MKKRTAELILQSPEKFAHHDRVFLNNPVVMQGMGLAPLVVVATTGQNSLMLAAAVALLLVPSRVLACLLSRLVPLRDDTDNFTTDLDTSLIDEILHDERKETVQKALDLLPEIQREVVILRYYHDLKVKDIATITGVGVSTVQSRIYQGLRKLEKVLEREEFYDG